MKTKTANLDLPTLWIHLDEVAGGALYALRYECETNGWKPHLWSQTPNEGGPCGLSRVFFIGVDVLGKTKYFDTVLLRDAEVLATKIKISETSQDALRAAKRLAEGLTRIVQGLDPEPYTEAVRGLN